MRTIIATPEVIVRLCRDEMTVDERLFVQRVLLDKTEQARRALNISWLNRVFTTDREAAEAFIEACRTADVGGTA